MGLFKTFHTRVFALMLFAALATAVVACGTDRPAADPTSEPTSSPGTPTPIPQSPTPPPTVSPTPTVMEENKDNIQVRLDEAIDRWEANGPESYTFDIAWLCFCAESGKVIRISVESGELASAVDVETGNTIETDAFGRHLTVDELFELIQETMDNDAGDVTQVQFERDLGYPISASLDLLVSAIDDEQNFQVTNFKIGTQDVDLEELRNRANNALFLWLENGPESYEFNFLWECFCPTSLVKITVESGQITSVIDVDTGEPAEAFGDLEFQTVPELLEWFTDKLDTNPEFATLQVHPENGHPTSARIDPIANLYDDEIGFSITNIAPLNTHTELQTELDAAKAKWTELGLTDYSFRFSWSCFCIDEYTAPMIVKVEDGAVTSVTRVEDGEPASEEFSDDFVTVDELFDRIQEAISRGAASIDADFDPESGLPTMVYIDHSLMIADEEIGWSAGEMTELE